jgi:hypothetical protein
VDRNDIGDKLRGWEIGCLTLDVDAVGGPWGGPLGSGAPGQGYIGRGTGASAGGSVAVVEPFADSTCQDKASRVDVERWAFEQRTRSEAIDVSPNMRGICRGSSEVGGGVDVGISFEENPSVARFYWLPPFQSPTRPI